MNYDDRVAFVSLCVAQRDSKNKAYWFRLGDVVGGALRKANVSKDREFKFENRNRLYERNDLPSIPKSNTIGLVKWTAESNRYNEDDDWHYFQTPSDCSLTRVFPVPNAKNIDDIKREFKKGLVDEYRYDGDALFVADIEKTTLQGLLCRRNEFEWDENGKIKLRDDVLVLSVFEMFKDDVVRFFPNGGQELYFLTDVRELRTEDAKGQQLTDDVVNVIRRLFRQRYSRKTFIGTGCTKNDWRDFIAKLERLGDESFRDYVVRELHCSDKQADKWIGSFIKRVDSVVEEGDVDETFIAKVIDGCVELRKRFEKEIEDKWNKANQELIEEANAERQKILEKIEEEYRDALAKTQKERQELETQRETARQERDELRAQIRNAEDKLAQIRKRVQDADALFLKTRERLANLSRDPQIIAETSALLSIFQAPERQDVRAKSCQYVVSETSEDRRNADAWRDEVKILADVNLRAIGVGDDWRDMLAAFLYSAFVNETSLLIAGPFAYEIADATSFAASGRGAGRVRIGENANADITEVAKIVESAKESTVVVENTLGQGWTDAAPQALTRCGKFVVWSRPYVDDLLVEPKGLFNYVLPLFSELFIETPPPRKPSYAAGQRMARFEEFPLNASVALQDGFEKLALSRLTRSRLMKTISDAKKIAAFRQNNAVKIEEMEILFGALPFSALGDQRNVLNEIARSRGDLSDRLKAEIARYAGEYDE